MTGYSFKQFEKKWQQIWRDEKTFEVMETVGKPLSYVLEMFPYPSGSLHMGHVRNYAIGDAIARFRRAQGYTVLHPIGWDAFGLPAENAAAEHNVDPAIWTNNNICSMKKQLQTLGFSFDWTREVTTCQPEYYGLEQKIFLDFLKKGLAYRKETLVNWDPAEGSVLANEQVIDGKGWRSGVLVERRKLTQWSLQITRYSEELLEGLSMLEKGWPEKVIRMQENWIGKSEGAIVRFPLTRAIALKNGSDVVKTVDVFTTRPETLFGAAFCALSPSHPLTEILCETHLDLAEFVKKCHQTPPTEEALNTRDKLGFDTGYFVYHPFREGEQLPVYVANFVLMDYGTGAVFGCPAHDERDFEFASNHNLPLHYVIVPGETVSSLPPSQPCMEGRMESGSEPGTKPWTGSGILTNSEFLDGLNREEARARMITEIERRQIGEGRTTYRLRDWCVSRQRYWGCPIPVIYCSSCGTVPVPENDLPVTLPTDVVFGKGGNPLENHPCWKHVDCPSCGKPAERETDTFDTFFESSWYFLRYCNPSFSDPVDKSACQKWVPVDWYIGGIEHAVLHLLYARFFTRALRDCGYVDIDEPFANLLTQGMVCHQTFQDQTGQWVFPHDVRKGIQGQMELIRDGSPVVAGRSEKMSKSRKNVVSVDLIMDAYGADAARLFVLSDSPPDRDFDWNDEGLEGAWRYINRIWRLGNRIIELTDYDGEPNATLKFRKIIHQSIVKFHKAFENNLFNKAIAYLRELTHSLESAGQQTTVSLSVIKEGLTVLLQGLNPVIPHITSELWSRFNKNVKLVDAAWPVADDNLAILEEITIAVQLNGKMRGSFVTSPGADPSFLEQQALALPVVVRDRGERPIRRIVVVPDRIVNIVL